MFNKQSDPKTSMCLLWCLGKLYNMRDLQLSFSHSLQQTCTDQSCMLYLEQMARMMTTHQKRDIKML